MKNEKYKTNEFSKYLESLNPIHVNKENLRTSLSMNVFEKFQDVYNTMFGLYRQTKEMIDETNKKQH